MTTIKTENTERSPQTAVRSTPSLVSENREPPHDASIPADEVGDVRSCNRALSLGLPPPRITSNGAQSNYLCDARLANYFSLHPCSGQPPVYHAMNGGQEQTCNPLMPQHGFHTTFQNTVDPQLLMQQQQPHTRMQTIRRMQSAQRMPQVQGVNAVAGHQDLPHDRMVPEVANMRKNISNFTQNANNFALFQTQLFNSMNARLVKAEYERDCLRAALSQQQQFGSRMNTPQTAPEFGSCTFHFRDGEDMRMSSPVTPSKPPQEIKHYSSPIQRNTSETAFGSKLTGTKNQKSEKTKARKDLKIKVPSQIPIGTLTAGLPTPANKASSTNASNSSTTTLTTSPLTAGRIGPSHPLTTRTSTIISKRKIHNLEKLLPSSTALIPLIPLTDTEIIVYFFQSLARPIVSLRLYARNWGPSNICDTLNAHRTIEGGYLRNTASVKCTTAIKRGKEKFGEAWAEELRDVFASADDIQATDLMQLSEEERAGATDFRVRDLSKELKMHPHEGMFTECVKWCVERKAGYTLGNVHELALALRRGEEPELLEDSEEEEEDDDDDEGGW